MGTKTSELTGIALDWAVAKCEGITSFGPPKGRSEAAEFLIMHDDDPVLNYSTNWKQGGLIIEREGINTFKHNKLDNLDADVWCAHKVVPRPNMEGSTNMVAIAPDGPTPLIAAMRCYVASKLGDEVEIPEELL